MTKKLRETVALCSKMLYTLINDAVKGNATLSKLTVRYNLWKKCFQKKLFLSKCIRFFLLLLSTRIPTTHILMRIAKCEILTTK